MLNALLILFLENPEYGIAKGQAGVIYDGNDAALMLGGGWISSAQALFLNLSIIFFYCFLLG